MHADFKYDFLVVSLRRVSLNTSEQRSRSGLCEGVIRREATQNEGLVPNNNEHKKDLRKKIFKSKMKD